MSPKKPDIKAGPDEVAKMLALMDEASRTRILSEIQSREPKLAALIAEKMVTFEKISLLTGRSLQIVIKETPQKELTLALRGASAELLDRFCKQMSMRAAETLREEIASLGPQKKSDIEKARLSIVERAKDLEKKGKISWVEDLV